MKLRQQAAFATLRSGLPAYSKIASSLDAREGAGSGFLITPLPLIYEGHSLVGHVSRANPHWHADGCESVAIFSGP